MQHGQRQNEYLPAEGDMTIKDAMHRISKIFKYLTSRWPVILVTMIIFGLLGIGYSIFNKPVYIASLSFALEDTKGGNSLGAYSGIASQIGLDVGSSSGGVFSGDNLIELMKSRSMVENTLLSAIMINGRKETLAELYIQFNNFRDKWKSDPELSEIHFLPGVDASKFSLKQDSLISVFHKTLILSNLSVDKIDKKLSITIVKVKSKNELFSKYFAELLVDKVSKFYVDTKTKKSTQNVNILQHQTDSVRNQLNLSINGVASSIDFVPNANPSKLVLKTPAQHKQIDVQVNNAILAELVKNLEIAKVSLRNETPLVQIIDTPVLPLEVDKVDKIKGLCFGMLIGGFLSVLSLITKKAFQVIS